MRITKTLLVLMALTLAGAAQADLHLKCADGVQLEACADKAEKTLIQMGCSVQTEATDCSFGLVQDPNSDNLNARIQTDTPLCTVKSSNCSHARDVLFQPWESCHESKEKIKIPKSSKVTNNYWTGIWAPYSRVVCKTKN